MVRGCVRVDVVGDMRVDVACRLWFMADARELVGAAAVRQNVRPSVVYVV